MKFHYKNKMVKVDMKEYVANMIAEFPGEVKAGDTAKTPAAENLFEVNDDPVLAAQQKEIFHTIIAKGLFVSKRARPDIQPAIAFLCTRVKEPNQADWKKLERLIRYLNGTRNKVLTLSVENLRVLKWYVDASFGVHLDFKSHTGGVLAWGRGAAISMSRKQKLNTESSTNAELVGAHDMSTMVLWTKLFLEEQGYPVEKNILFQDNKSAILLEINGRKSAGKRSRALNVRYFFLTDQIEKGNLSVEYCPTDLLIADFMTKPLQGSKFSRFRSMILGEMDP